VDSSFKIQKNIINQTPIAPIKALNKTLLKIFELSAAKASARFRDKQPHATNSIVLSLIVLVSQQI
jgi:hypothetical protein